MTKAIPEASKAVGGPVRLELPTVQRLNCAPRSVAWLLHIVLTHKGLATNMVSMPLGTQHLREATTTGNGNRI